MDYNEGPRARVIRGNRNSPLRQAPSLGFSSPPYIPALTQLSLSLGAKTFPDHAVQLRATLHHHVQLRADGGVRKDDMDGGRMGRKPSMGLGCGCLGEVFRFDIGDGCARVRVGRTSSVPLRYGASGLRALFRVGGARDGHWLVRLRTTQV